MNIELDDHNHDFDVDKFSITNFLLDPTPGTNNDSDSVLDTASYLSDNQMEALSILSLISASISALGSGSVLACSLYHRRVCVAEIFPTFHLAVSDFLSALFVIISSTTFLMGEPSYPGSGGSCNYIMPLVTSFFTSAFLLTITYALEALFRFRRRLTASFDSFSARVISTRWMWLIYMLSWVFPLGFAILVMAVAKNLKDVPDPFFDLIPHQCSLCFAVFWFSEESCWAPVIDGSRWHEIIRLVFLLPLIFSIISNLVLYIMIGKVFKQVAMRRGLLSYHQRQEENNLKKKAMLYQGVFFFCWIPSVILGIFSFTPGYKMNDFYWLLLIQAILGPLHGIMNSLLYGWRRDSFRRALTESTSLLSTNRTMSVTL